MTRQISDVDEGTVRRVDWQELVPPTIFFRAFPATFKVSFLILGALGIALFAFAFGFRGQASPYFDPFGMDEPTATRDSDSSAAKASPFSLVEFSTWNQATRIDNERTWAPIVWILGFVVALLFALAVSRTTLARLTTTSRSSTLSSLRFAILKAPSLIVPVLIPSVLAFSLYLSGIFVAKCGGVGELCAPIVAAALFALFVLTLVTSCSTPLALSAIAADRSDGFDATSRAISYLTQRFAFWLLYYFFAAILTLVGLAITESVTRVVLWFFNEIYGSTLRFEAWTNFWRLVLIAVPTAYLYVSFVVYSNAIYVALRRSVDGTPYDECAFESNGEKPRKLRRILQDVKGAPVLDDSRKNDAEATKVGKDESN